MDKVKRENEQLLLFVYMERRDWAHNVVVVVVDDSKIESLAEVC